MECCIFTGIQMGTHHKRTGSDMLFQDSWTIHKNMEERPVNTPVIEKIGKQI